MVRPPYVLGCPLLVLLLVGMLSTLPLHAEPTDALAEIQALRERGGFEATQGLERWIRGGSEEERIAALEAVAEVGVRTRKIATAVRDAADRGASVALQTAALAALGRIGGPDDVEPLIDLLKGREESLRGAAHRALGKLTGRRTAQDYGRWYQWWRREGRHLQAGVRGALQRLPGAVVSERAKLRTLLTKDGWTEIRSVEDAAKDWLRASDRTLRTQAFHLVAVLRLGEAASDVESALPFLSTVDGEDGLRALRVLGLDPERLAPYWRKRLEGGR